MLNSGLIEIGIDGIYVKENKLILDRNKIATNNFNSLEGIDFSFNINDDNIASVTIGEDIFTLINVQTGSANSFNVMFYVLILKNDELLGILTTDLTYCSPLYLDTYKNLSVCCCSDYKELVSFIASFNNFTNLSIKWLSMFNKINLCNILDKNNDVFEYVYKGKKCNLITDGLECTHTGVSIVLLNKVIDNKLNTYLRFVGVITVDNHNYNIELDINKSKVYFDDYSLNYLYLYEKLESKDDTFICDVDLCNLNLFDIVTEAYNKLS